MKRLARLRLLVNSPAVARDGGERDDRYCDVRVGTTVRQSKSVPGYDMTISSVRQLVLALALTTSGCALVEPTYSGTVDVSATAEGILVSNETNYTVQVYSLAEAALPLWDTALCIGGTRLLPGETRSFVWASVYQSSPAPSRYRTMWWRDGTCSFGTDDGPRGAMTVSR